MQASRSGAAQVDDQMKFYLSAAAGALGVLVTLLFIPDISTLDLAEGDRRWDALKAGEAQPLLSNVWSAVLLECQSLSDCCDGLPSAGNQIANPLSDDMHSAVAV